MQLVVVKWFDGCSALASFEIFDPDGDRPRGQFVHTVHGSNSAIC